MTETATSSDTEPQGATRALGRSRSTQKPPWWRYEITPKKIKLDELMNFSRQAASFIRAGIPILDALAVIGEDATNKKLREVLTDVGTRLRNGASFSQAIGAHSQAFPSYYVSMVRAAELTGRLDDILDQLAHYIERDLAARRRIKAAVRYPAVIVVMSIVTVIVLASFVLPRFQDFFESLDAKLPLPTRMLLAFTDFLTSTWIVLAIGFVALVVVVFVGLRFEDVKYRRDALVLRLPALGSVVRFSIIERFCRLLTAMVQSGVPLPDALLVTTEATQNRVFQKGLLGAREEVMRGAGLAVPIAATGLFPAAARQMIRVGESTGTLDQQLGSAAEFYERELDYRLERFTELFEPAIVLLVGLVVGFVAVALVSAMYGIFNQVDI